MTSSLRSLGSKALAAVAALLPARAGAPANASASEEDNIETKKQTPTQVADFVKDVFKPILRVQRLGSNRKLSSTQQAEIMGKAEAKRERRKKRPNGWSAS